VSARPVFPFTALVGQARLKEALALNAVDPRIGGVLIRGEKGTAKSTAVRAFARLLPEVEVVVGCPYGCDPADPCAECAARDDPPRIETRRVPLVELPVGATEDRLVGTLNLEHAIREGERVFEPGLLAAANRGVLYVDEVNLLGDHLVDVLLDAAAMGRNYVEREGVSVQHPASFILVGTMNPEEGELRPQLLDRFALAVDVVGLADPADRAEVVRRRVAFETDPVGFLDRWRDEEERERARIAAARAQLPDVAVPDAMLELVTRTCAAFGVDGLRGDIVTYKTARARAAYHGRAEVSDEDVRVAAELALLHRRRRQPFDEPEQGRERLEQVLDELANGGEAGDQGDDTPSPHPGPAGRGDERREHVFEVGAAPPLALARPPAPARTGRRVWARVPRGEALTHGNLALDATLRAAAPYQAARHRAAPSPLRLIVTPPDLRESVREARQGVLVLFALDASGSMAARRRMVAVKGAVMALLLDAYQKRDEVGLVAFRGQDARLVLPPTASVELAARALRALPTGGRTPLAHALVLCETVLARARLGDAERTPWLVLVSDGRPNVALGADPVEDARRVAVRLRQSGTRALVVDTEEGPVRLGLNRRLAEAMGAEYLRLDDLDAATLVGAVRTRIGVQRL